MTVFLPWVLQVRAYSWPPPDSLSLSAACRASQSTPVLVPMPALRLKPSGSLQSVKQPWLVFLGRLTAAILLLYGHALQDTQRSLYAVHTETPSKREVLSSASFVISAGPEYIFFASLCVTGDEGRVAVSYVNSPVSSVLSRYLCILCKNLFSYSSQYKNCCFHECDRFQPVDPGSDCRRLNALGAVVLSQFVWVMLFSVCLLVLKHSQPPRVMGRC